MSDTVKPSHTEDDYFAKEDAEKKRKLAQKVHRDMAAEEAKRLRDLHHGHCPGCGQQMHEVNLRGGGGQAVRRHARTLDEAGGVEEAGDGQARARSEWAEGYFKPTFQRKCVVRGSRSHTHARARTHTHTHTCI